MRFLAVTSFAAIQGLLGCSLQTFEADGVTQTATEGANLRADDADLIAAAGDGYNPESPKTLEALLKKGADPNAKDATGQTAMHHAVRGSNAKGLAVLIRGGGRLTSQDNQKATPLMGYFDISFSPFGTPPYIFEAYRELGAYVRTLLRTMTKDALGLDLQGADGKTLLHKFAARSQLDEVKLVLDKGANPNLQDAEGNTTAMVVARQQRSDYVDVLKALVDGKADLRITNNAGDTILSTVPNEVSKSLAAILKTWLGQAYVDEILSKKSTITTERTAAGALALRTYSKDSAQACKALETLRGNLTAWRTRVGAPPPAAASPCTCRGLSCQLLATDSAPERFLALEGTRNPANGPNCFNSALYGNGNLAHIRHTTAAEMKDYVASVCREKSPSESDVAGDLVVVFFKPVSFGDLPPEEGPIHAFTTISSDYAFSKDGFDKSVPYSLTFTADMFRKYSVAPHLQKTTAAFIKTYRADVTLELRRDNGFNYSIRYDCRPNVNLAMPGTTGALKTLAAEVAALETNIATFLAEGASADATRIALEARVGAAESSLKKLAAAERDKAHLATAIESLREGFIYLKDNPGGGGPFPGF